MRVSTRFAVVILLITMGMTTLSLGAVNQAAAQGGKRYVLIGKGSSLPAGLESLVVAVGGQVVYQLDEIGIAVVESDEPAFADAAAGIAGLKAVVEDRPIALALPEQGNAVVVESLESVQAETAAVEGTNPAQATLFFAQWNMRAIGALPAWNAGYMGDPRVKVAVLDTGIDYTQLDLVGQVDMTLSRSFFSEPLPPGAAPFLDVQGHGTHVAGIIAAKGTSVTGVAPRVKLIAVKVAGRAGFAEFGTITAAIKYAVDAGAAIINMSFGEALTRDQLKEDHLRNALLRAVNYAHSNGVLLVASAGNSGIDWDAKEYKQMTKVPAQLPHVLGVSATGPQFGANMDGIGVVPMGGVPHAYTDYGRSIISFAAPGGSVTNFVLPNGMPADRILSTCARFSNPGCASGRANVFMVGTSMAAAHISGVAALALSAVGGTGAEVAHVLMTTADDFGQRGKDEWYGYGRINAYRAVTGK